MAGKLSDKVKEEIINFQIDSIKKNTSGILNYDVLRIHLANGLENYFSENPEVNIPLSKNAILNEKVDFVLLRSLEKKQKNKTCERIKNAANLYGGDRFGGCLRNINLLNLYKFVKNNIAEYKSSNFGSMRNYGKKTHEDLIFYLQKKGLIGLNE